MGALSSGANRGQGPKHSSTSSGQNIKAMFLAKFVMVFCKQRGQYLQERMGAKRLRHLSTSSGKNIKTMLLANFVITSKM